MRPYILLLVLTIAGCTTATEMYGPEGERLISIDCTAASGTMAPCYEKAAEVCPAGYRLIERTDTVGAPVITAFAVTHTARRSVVVECK